jgi:hypothetical protein
LIQTYIYTDFLSEQVPDLDSGRNQFTYLKLQRESEEADQLQASMEAGWGRRKSAIAGRRAGAAHSARRSGAAAQAHSVSLSRLEAAGRLTTPGLDQTNGGPGDWFGDFGRSFSSKQIKNVTKAPDYKKVNKF